MTTIRLILKFLDQFKVGFFLKKKKEKDNGITEYNTNDTEELERVYIAYTAHASPSISALSLVAAGLWISTVNANIIKTHFEERISVGLILLFFWGGEHTTDITQSPSPGLRGLLIARGVLAVAITSAAKTMPAGKQVQPTNLFHFFYIVQPLVYPPPL